MESQFLPSSLLTAKIYNTVVSVKGIYLITINVPVVFMAVYVIILRRAVFITRASIRDGLF
jgi:hypothetical protein